MAQEPRRKGQEYRRLAIALAILGVILVSLLLWLSWPGVTGTDVILATRPIDPFDPLRGQYLVINYEASDVPTVAGAGKDSTVYVSLAPDAQGVWRAQGASLEKPQGGTVFLRGTVEWTSENRTRVRYGIEQFFIERGSHLPQGNLTVHARVGKDGRATIRQLLIDGEPAQLEYRPVTLKS